jgi:hypothetical protein
LAVKSFFYSKIEGSSFVDALNWLQVKLLSKIFGE